MVGNGLFKLFRYSEGNLKQFGIQLKIEPQNYLCQAWISDERVMVGTDTGRLMLFEAGELKSEINLIQQEESAGKEKYVAVIPFGCSIFGRLARGYALKIIPAHIGLPVVLKYYNRDLTFDPPSRATESSRASLLAKGAFCLL